MTDKKERTAAKYLQCDDCSLQIDIRQPVNICPRCNGLLEIIYSHEELKKSAGIFRTYKHDSIWRYRDFFPPVSNQNIVSLGEGGTPLIKSCHISRKLGVENIFFKNDTMMPTGSFKDRGFSLAISYAKEIGVRKGLTYSSGNAGSSFSCYSSRADFSGVILVDHLSSPLKKSMILLYGSRSSVIEFSDFEQISKLLDDAVNELGCYMFVNFINPIRHEAMKTYAYEIFSELQRVPDFMIHPVGTGGGLWGTWKGYNELANLGVTDRLPRMIGVQPYDVRWLKIAIDNNDLGCHPFGNGSKTIAQSISGNSPLRDGKRLVEVIRKSNGLALAVTDEEILEAMRDLGREGIAAEASSASSVAALKQAVKDGKIKSRDYVVCTITGSALKQPSVVQQAASTPESTINVNVDDLKKLLIQFNML